MIKKNSQALPRNSVLLIVASTGGHLTQSVALADLLNAQDTTRWVTFPGPQTSSLLSGRPHTLVPYVAPRKFLAAVRTFPEFMRLLKKERYDAVVSTGAAVAVPALIAAVLCGVPAYYVESVSRVLGPSLTGKILAFVPRINLFTQHSNWAKGRWQYDVSVFDKFIFPTNILIPPTTGTESWPRSTLKVFVTLGTIRPYRFDALIDAVVRAVESSRATEVMWQLGATERADVPGLSFTELDVGDFERLANQADVVISHAGIGTCLRLVQMGIYPIVVPRRRDRGEHVDDHQLQIANELAARDLCACVDASLLSLKLIRTVAAISRSRV